MAIKKLARNDARPATRALAQYLDLEKAVDYLIDETPEGAPFRDGKVFVRGDYISVVDPNHPLHRQVRSVIGAGRTSDGKATVRLRGNTVANPNHPLLNNTDGGTTVFVVDARDTVVLADCCRRWHGKLQQYIDDWTRRRLFALPLIVRACVDGAWKARGQRPGSAEWEHILNTDFKGSEINEATGDLMATPGPTSTRPESKVAIWTELMFAVPGGADEGKVAELSEPAEPRSSVVRPNRAGRKKGSGSYDVEDAPLLKEIEALVENEKPMALWNAALSVADRARGKGDIYSRAKRLVIKYKERPDLR